MSLLVTLALLVCGAEPHHFEVETARSYRVADLPVTLTLRAVDAEGAPLPSFCGTASLEGVEVPAPGAERETVPLTETAPFVGGVTTLEGVHVGEQVVVGAGDARTVWRPDLRTLPGWLSILPPLFAIVLAIASRQAMVALFAGIWLGALFLYDYDPLSALLRVFDTHLVAAVSDGGHAAILLFTLALGGVVGVLARSGGTSALVDVISKRARTRRSGMVTSWFTGLVVFFDDYANCLLVGNTLRPFTDELKISREKLAYIVDSTAAPISTVALISTWVGYQLGLLQDLAETAGRSPYDLFLDLLPYSFYSFFSLGFVLLLALTLRDFGPMLRAERRALAGHVLRPGAQPLMDRELTDMEPPSGRTPHWALAVVPIASVIAIVTIGLYASGRAAAGPDAGLRAIIAAADSYAVLLWAGFGGGLVAAVMAVGSRTLRFGEAVDAWIAGVKAMVIACIILVLAWTIGDLCKDYLQTGPWVLSQLDPSPHWVPVLTFLVSAVIALATGSSFSTMAIVIPIAGPMAWALTGDGVGLDPDVVWSIRYATLAAVLSGAVFGDHCSPISDTTIMSSMSCASDHVDHVRTQAPYATLCAGVAIVAGYLPAGYGVSPWLSLPLGFAILAGLLLTLGRRA